MSRVQIPSLAPFNFNSFCFSSIPPDSSACFIKKHVESIFDQWVINSAAPLVKPVGEKVKPPQPSPIWKGREGFRVFDNFHWRFFVGAIKRPSFCLAAAG